MKNKGVTKPKSQSNFPLLGLFLHMPPNQLKIQKEANTNAPMLFNHTWWMQRYKRECVAWKIYVGVKLVSLNVRDHCACLLQLNCRLVLNWMQRCYRKLVCIVNCLLLNGLSFRFRSRQANRIWCGHVLCGFFFSLIEIMFIESVRHKRREIMLRMYWPNNRIYYIIGKSWFCKKNNSDMNGMKQIVYTNKTKTVWEKEKMKLKSKNKRPK